MTIRWTPEQASAHVARVRPVPATPVAPAPPNAPARRTRSGAWRPGPYETGTPPVPGSDRDEAVVDREVAALAKRAGARAYHTKDSRESPEGFPDWVIGWPAEASMPLLVIESKRERPGHGRGRLTAAQLGWLRAFGAAGQRVMVARPQDVDSGDVARAFAPREP